jgi:hypothetical protein
LASAMEVMAPLLNKSAFTASKFCYYSNSSIMSYLHNVNKKRLNFSADMRSLVNRTNYNHTAIRI